MGKNEIIAILVVAVLMIALVISALTGENGIIAQNRETELLNNLSNIIEEIEKNIANVKANNPQTKLTSAEMMKELEKNGQISLNKRGTYQGMILSSKIPGLVVTYNGDIYLDNYKRGEISLSSQMDEITYSNPFISKNKQKLKVIDGTIENVKDEQYIIKCLEDRNDFACWINNSGEIVSIEKEMPFANEAQNNEYIALYDYEQKEKFANRYVITTTSNAYADDTNVYFNVMVYNYDNRVTKKDYLYDEATEEYEDAFIGKTQINSIGMYISDNAESLINLRGTHITSYNLSEIAEPQITDYDSGVRLNLLNCKMDLSTLKSELEGLWGKELSRVYYRAGVDANYYMIEGENELTPEEMINFCTESAVKYIDF